MTDVRKMFDKDFLYSYDLEGRDVTVTIERVVGGTLVGTGGKSSRKPILYFKGKKKGLGLNITNARIIAGLYGGSFDSEKWLGKKIVLYPTTTTFGKDTVDCIRVRNVLPRADAKDDTIREDVPPPDSTERTSTPPLTSDALNYAGVSSARTD